MRFDFHGVSPFINDTENLAVFFPCEKLSTWESDAAGVAED
jgi:hypothetical protein